MQLMQAKILDSKYYHIRYGRHRFAQWRVGQEPTNKDFFGWWSETEKREAVKLANEASNSG